MKTKLFAKTLLVLALFFGAASAFAQLQDVRYYDLNEQPVKETKAHYFGIVEATAGSAPAGSISFYTLDSVLVSRKAYSDVNARKGKMELHGTSSSWYKNGQKQSETTYAKGQRHGSSKEWYESGSLRYAMTFEKGMLQDTLYGYYESGKLRRKDIYKDWKLLKGEVFSEAGTPIPYVQHLEMPQFPGGDDRMMRHLAVNVRYPAEAQRRGMSGMVVVKFLVEADGTMKDFVIHKSVNSLLDKEALRVVQGMPKWTPGKKEGVAEAMTAYVPIRFTIR